MDSGEYAVPRQVWASRLAVASAGGVLLGLVGPFGSFFNGPAWQRIVYWLAIAWLAAGVLGLCNQALARLPLLRPRPWVRLAFSAVMGSIPLSVGSWFLARAIWPALSRVPDLTPAAWLTQGLIITLAAAVLFALVRRHPVTAIAPIRTPPSSDLLGVPADQVLCLKMEDHYVRVQTARGSRMVAATLTQAVAAFGPRPGLQVHRSWWVADKAVVGSALDGRNLRLILSNGMEVPVARSSVAAVRGQGWLERTGRAEP